MIWPKTFCCVSFGTQDLLVQASFQPYRIPHHALSVEDYWQDKIDTLLKGKQRMLKLCLRWTLKHTWSEIHLEYLGKCGTKNCSKGSLKEFGDCVGVWSKLGWCKFVHTHTCNITGFRTLVCTLKLSYFVPKSF